MNENNVEAKEERPVSPGRFWEAFAIRFREDLRKLWGKNEGSKNPTIWTKKVKDSLFKIGKDLGFTDELCHGYCRGISTEFMRIDVGYFRAHKMFDEFGYNWDFEVAIEHENDPKQWLNEFIKLLHVNAGLKVIISYSNDEKQLKDMLNTAIEIRNTRKYCCQKDNFLIIVGPFSNKKGKDFRAFSICGKLFSLKKIEEIEITGEKKILLTSESDSPGLSHL